MDDLATDQAHIPDGAIVWRRIPSWPDWTVHDDNLGRLRPSSLAFKDDRDGSHMSMYLADGGNTIEEIMAGHEDFGLAQLYARELRAYGLTIVRRPEPNFPSHIEVEGEKTSRLRSALAKAATWVIRPPQNP
jgi:hypothetical protein